MSRRKGASSERELAKELVRLFALHGLGASARRTAPLQAGAVRGLVADDLTAADVTCSLLPDDHVEAKRDECGGRAIREALPAWCEQSRADAVASGKRWLVAWRQNRQPWRVTTELGCLTNCYEECGRGMIGAALVTLSLADFVAVRAAQGSAT